LEEMYIIFRVSPFHRNVARSILKSPKYYFYDTGQVAGDPGARLENLVACALLKEIQYLADCHGEEIQLYYLKDKDVREIDFCIARKEYPETLIEVKWGEERISANFKVFRKYFPKARMIQLVKELKKEKTFPDGAEIRRASKWLSQPVLSAV